MNKKADLEIMQRYVGCLEKFSKVKVDVGYDLAMKATTFHTMGIALGECIETFEFPAEWERLLKRKDCPKYMKEMATVNINVYYPRISFPEEKHWVTAEPPYTKTTSYD